MEEMYSQADAERLEGLPVSRNMDRNQTSTADVQVGYIDWIVFPVVGLLTVLLPELPMESIEQLRKNRETWSEEVFKENLKREKSPRRGSSKKNLSFGNGQTAEKGVLRDMRKSLFRKSMGANGGASNAVAPAGAGRAAGSAGSANSLFTGASSAARSEAAKQCKQQANVASAQQKIKSKTASDYDSQRNMRLSPALETAFQAAVEEVESKGAYQESAEQMRAAKQRTRRTSMIGRWCRVIDPFTSVDCFCV
jgi:hypothetical protein